MKKRNSNLEILRIVSIIFIILGHFSIHGVITANNGDILKDSFIDFLTYGGNLGVNCFVLISGYFMVDSKFTLKKFLKIVGEIFFYSTIVYLIFYLVKPLNYMTIGYSLKNVFLPVLYSTYWFATTYILLMILSPFINKVITNIDKKSYNHLILILLIICSLIPNFLSTGEFFSNLGWFVFLYLIAGAIKYNTYRYYDKKLLFYVKSSLILILILFIYVFLINYIGYKNNSSLLKYSTYFNKLTSPLLLIMSVSFFLMFSKLNIKNSNLINVMASGTFGVYLIHENPLMRMYLWNDLFQNQIMYDTMNSLFLLLYIIFVIISIYLVCTIIDLIRQKTIEKGYLYITNKILNKFDKKEIK